MSKCGPSRSVIKRLNSKLAVTVFAFVVALATYGTGTAGDWPTWGGNAARSGVSADALPETLHLSWTLKLRAPDAAWHSNQPKVQFDRIYEPIVAGKRMFVGSMVGDRLTAYDTATGKELWRFYTEGPVRLAPSVSNGKVYFVCDDGHLYCVRAADGSLAWKLYGAPLDRKVLGNDRLVSIYPARGAPVVYDDTVYFATSVWPFMGVFIHAVNADTGELIWTNSGTGSMYIPQQHDREAFAGVAPQGYLVATKKRLLVAGGQTAPACFDRETGKFVHLNLHSRQMGSKGGGGYYVRATKDFFVIQNDLFRMSDGSFLAKVDNPIITDDMIVGVDSGSVIHAYEHEMKIEKGTDRKDRPIVNATLKERWKGKTDPPLGRLHFMAGHRLYGTGANGLIAAVDITEKTGEPEVSWSSRVEGEPLNMIAADDRLFVSTDKGEIICFAGSQPPDRSPGLIDEAGVTTGTTASGNDQKAEVVANLLKETGASTGYCVQLGIGDGRLLDELISQSKLHVIVLEPDEQKVAVHRRRLDDCGLYGKRVAVHTGDILSINLPPYMAQLVIAENVDAAGFARGNEFAERMFHVLRPYGGVAHLPCSQDQHDKLDGWVDDEKFAGGSVTRSGDGSHTQLTRVGRLPGSDDWTHQYADAGNSVVSNDQLVKAPMGVLWFGGPSNEKVLPRHGHGPSPQVVGGRLFIEGRNMLRAVDVYTGLQLWEREFVDLGKHYDYISHEPGAGAIGSNYVSTPDSVYVFQGDTCHRLEAASGKTLAEFKAPPMGESESQVDWGCVWVVGDVLVGAVEPVNFKTKAFNVRELRKQGKELLDKIQKLKDFEIVEHKKGEWEPPNIVENLNRLLFSKQMVSKIPDDARKKADVGKLEKELQEYLAGGENRETDSTSISKKRALLEKYFDLPVYTEPRIGTYGSWSKRSSRRLVGMNRFTGERLWEVPAFYSFRHNAIAAGNGKVFALDRMQDAEVNALRRRGKKEVEHRRIVAIDIETGEEVWTTDHRIFGTFLNYSEEHDVVVQAGSAAGDRASDEVGKGIVAYQGRDGNVLWESDASYSGPLMLHHETVLSQPGPGHARNLLTGEQKMRVHPLSGELVEWTYGRNGGCNTAICSEHLITFRSSAAGFFDLTGDSGTGNWGGFRSSCTANLIPAGGVLNAPDYTRTCICAFQNRSSLALVHMPEVDVWTFNRFEWDGKQVQHAGLNFGAPGDRRSPGGLLWLDTPSIGGDSPDLPVTIEGEAVEYFRRHPSQVNSENLSWVACCGVAGAKSINIRLNKDDSADERAYTVRLYFSELENHGPGERIFDVQLQGKPVLVDFDVANEAGAADRGIIKEFSGVRAGKELQIDLKANAGRSLLCGVEIVAEDN